MAIPARKARACVGLYVMCTVFTANSSRAAEWSALPSVAVRTEYDDNIRLTTAPHPTVWGIIVSPLVNFSADTETLKVTGGLGVNVNRYFGEEGLDTVDYLLTLRSRYEGERDLLALNVDAIRDSTLVSELLETGVVEERRQRNRLSVNPSWTRALSEVITLTANYAYSSVNYADTAGTNLIDYTDQNASIGATWKLSEYDLANVTGYYDRYETRPAQLKADTYGIQAAYERDFSETLHAALSLGVRQTHSTLTSQGLVCEGTLVFGFCFGSVAAITLSETERSTGYTALASVEQRWQTDRLVGSVSRQLNPTGIGALAETDRLLVRWTRQWSETVTSSLEGSVYRTRYVGNAVATSNSNFYRIQPTLSWRVSEGWTLTGGYSYSLVKYDQTSATARANVAYLIASYTWPKFSISR